MDRITSENEEETEKKMGRLEKRLQEMERNATSTGLRAPMDVVRNGRWSVGARGRCPSNDHGRPRAGGRGESLSILTRITITFFPTKKIRKKKISSIFCT